VTRIEGHDAQTDVFATAMRGERMAHAWIFAGPQGIGKASLAKRLGQRLLAEAAGMAPGPDPQDLPRDHPIAKLVEGHAHPDFRLIEREAWGSGKNSDKLIPYAERDGSEDLARSIRVLQIRWLEPVLALAPSMSKRRVIVIDAAEDMERSAANALLKNLEEPPQGTIFVLVSHAPGRLLPTVRSRCRMLRFQPLADDVMAALVRRALPDSTPEAIDALVRRAGGSPGAALGMAGLELDAIDAALARIAATGDATNAERTALAQKLSGKAAQPRYEALLARAPAFIAAQAQTRDGDALAEAIAQWETARDLAQRAVQTSLDPQSTVFALLGHVAALAPDGGAAKA
jgi:DNA polymerase III subunit delta'